jgi:hypothetical protein
VAEQQAYQVASAKTPAGPAIRAGPSQIQATHQAAWLQCQCLPHSCVQYLCSVPGFTSLLAVVLCVEQVPNEFDMNNKIARTDIGTLLALYCSE